MRSVLLSSIEVKLSKRVSSRDYGELYADGLRAFSPREFGAESRLRGVHASFTHYVALGDELVSYRVFKASPEARLRRKWLLSATPGCSQTLSRCMITLPLLAATESIE